MRTNVSQSETPENDPRQDQKAWNQLCDSSGYVHTKPEIERLTDETLLGLVESSIFEAMNPDEQVSILHYIVCAKRAMYRCYF